jgi:hypothetical protein
LLEEKDALYKTVLSQKSLRKKARATGDERYGLWEDGQGRIPGCEK